jgi:hypothetical protein
MKIDLLLIQLAIVFLPGIVWARLDAQYAMKSKPSDSEFVLRAIMFGLASYAVLFVIYSVIGRPFVFVDLGAADKQTVVTHAVAVEVFGALLVGLVLAVLWIYAATYKWLSKSLKAIKATKKYGDEDVWDYTFNSGVPDVEYIHFRDIENKVVYGGWVKEFSETDKLRELVLGDVVVYDEDAKELYRTPMLYLARKPEDIHIEFPYGSVPEAKESSDAAEQS